MLRIHHWKQHCRISFYCFVLIFLFLPNFWVIEPQVASPLGFDQNSKNYDTTRTNSDPFSAILRHAHSYLRFDKNRAYTYLADQVHLGYRIPGTPESIECQNYIVDQLSNVSESVYFHNFNFKGTDCTNIIVKMNKGAGDILIFAAHYDTRAIAENDDDVSKQDSPILGANDGASGVAVVMEMLQTLYLNRSKIPYEIWGIFFDAEDQGDGGKPGWDWIEGSKALAQDLENPNHFLFTTGQSLESIEAFILFDMVGGTNLQFIHEGHSDQQLLSSIFQTGQQLGYKDQFPDSGRTYSVIDDHLPFVNRGVKAVNLIINFWANPGWPYHHTTLDNLDNIDINSLEITGRTVEMFVYLNYMDAFGGIPDDWPPPATSGPPTRVILISAVGLGVVSLFLLIKIKKRTRSEVALDEKNRGPKA